MTRLLKDGRRGFLDSLLFIVGHPLSHSLSPAMQNGVIARLGLPLKYIGVDLKPGSLADFFRVVRAGNFLGGNVTIPFKEEAAALADERSDAVSACGAANVIIARDGRLFADNTDGRGLMDALKGEGWGRRFPRVVILGAGGSARGIAYELCRSGTRSLAILNRHPSRAEDIVRVLSPRFPGASISAAELNPSEMKDKLPGTDLIVQCTSLGLSGEWKNFPIADISKSSCFADIVYRKGGTLLVRRLRKRGVKAVDGLGMLAHQAARSFLLWTGKRVPAENFISFARKQLQYDN